MFRGIRHDLAEQSGKSGKTGAGFRSIAPGNPDNPAGKMRRPRKNFAALLNNP
jgi:hypothetical protein